MLSKLELMQEKVTDSQHFLKQSLSYGERVKLILKKSMRDIVCILNSLKELDLQGLAPLVV